MDAMDMVRIGASFEAEHVFERDASQAFARDVGDLNPVHHDETVAAASRFGGLIASGTETTARMLAITATYFAQIGPVVGLGFSVRFRRAVPMGARARTVWTVTSIVPKAGLGDVVTCEGTMTLIDSGLVVLEASCESLMLPPP